MYGNPPQVRSDGTDKITHHYFECAGIKRSVLSVITITNKTPLCYNLLVILNFYVQCLGISRNDTKNQ